MGRTEPNEIRERIHAMTSAPTTRKVKRFRVKIGESYATLDFNLHEKGALVRCHSVIGSHVFN